MTAPPISDGDRALLVAYADGELENDRCRELEQRLDRDPELADALRQMLAIDAVREAISEPRELHQPRRAAPDRGAGPLSWLLLAAAAVMVGLVWSLLPPKLPVLSFEVAALPVGFDLVEHSRLLGLGSELPRDNAAGRGAAEQQHIVPAETYLADVRAAEQRLVEAGFAEQRRRDRERPQGEGRAPVEVTSGLFAIAFEPAEACSAIVVQAVDGDGVALRYPVREAGGDWPENRFAAGRLHVLPGPIVEPASATRVELDNDRFQRTVHPDAPSAEVVEWWALAVRAAPVTDREYGELLDYLHRLGEPPLPRGDRAKLEARATLAARWLAARGFSTRLLRVAAP